MTPGLGWRWGHRLAVPAGIGGQRNRRAAVSRFLWSVGSMGGWSVVFLYRVLGLLDSAVGLDSDSGAGLRDAHVHGFHVAHALHQIEHNFLPRADLRVAEYELASGRVTGAH